MNIDATDTANTLVGFRGSREESLQVLRDFIANEGYDFRRVRGVHKIGKSRVVLKALADYQEEHSTERIDRLAADPVYRKFGIDGVALSLVSALGKDGKELERRLHPRSLRRRFTQGEKSKIILRYLEQRYRDQDKVLICLAITEIDSSHEHLWILLVGGTGKPALKWVLKERSNSGAIKLKDALKPYLKRDVAFVNGLQEQEVYEFIRLHLGGITGNWQLGVALRFESVLANFCGGHPDLLESICGWLVGLQGLKKIDDSWKEALETERSIATELLHVAILNQNELKSKIKDICGDLSDPARNQVEAVVKGHRPRITKTAIFDELVKAGLVLQDGRLSGVVQFFHPEVVLKNLRNPSAVFESLDWSSPAQGATQEPQANNEKEPAIGTQESSTSGPGLRTESVVRFIKETRNSIFASSYGGDVFAKREHEFESALAVLKEVQDSQIPNWVAEQIERSETFPEKQACFERLVRELTSRAWK
jgi:hypothetical protein